MNPWSLPTVAELTHGVYRLNTDYRDILEIFSWLEDADQPMYLRWEVALALFYKDPLEPADRAEGMEFFCRFITGGAEPDKPGVKLIDWQQDATAILSDINRVAGTEVRSLKYVHWWTFLSWFHGIGQGQLSTLVSIRDKLRRGKKLEDWEKEFYRENKSRVDLKKRYSQEEQQERARLEALLSG